MRSKLRGCVCVDPNAGWLYAGQERGRTELIKRGERVPFGGRQGGSVEIAKKQNQRNLCTLDSLVMMNNPLGITRERTDIPTEKWVVFLGSPETHTRVTNWSTVGTRPV